MVRVRLYYALSFAHTVRSYGTEGRKEGNQIRASTEVFDHIVFKGSDIETLNFLNEQPSAATPAPAPAPAPQHPPMAQQGYGMQHQGMYAMPQATMMGYGAPPPPGMYMGAQQAPPPRAWNAPPPPQQQQPKGQHVPAPVQGKVTQEMEKLDMKTKPVAQTIEPQKSQNAKKGGKQGASDGTKAAAPEKPANNNNNSRQKKSLVTQKAAPAPQPAAPKPKPSSYASAIGGPSVGTGAAGVARPAPTARGGGGAGRTGAGGRGAGGRGASGRQPVPAPMPMTAPITYNTDFDFEVGTVITAHILSYPGGTE